MVDGNRYESTHHLQTADELSPRLVGGWVACSKESLFGGNGIWLDASGRASALLHDGQRVTSGDSAGAWQADAQAVNPARPGLAFRVADAQLWAVIALDDSIAVMGAFGPSYGTESLYVHVKAP